MTTSMSDYKYRVLYNEADKTARVVVGAKKTRNQITMHDRKCVNENYGVKNRKSKTAAH